MWGSRIKEKPAELGMGDKCTAEFMFEPDDNYFSVSFDCQKRLGHSGAHTHKLKSEDDPNVVIEIQWKPGNVSISDSKRIRAFPIGSWRPDY